MDKNLFLNSPSGRIVKVGTGEAEYWAFAPNPLPPPLVLGMDSVALLSEADRALGELAGLGRTLPNANLLIRPFVRREAVLSSRIEGTQASIADLYQFEAAQLPLPGAPTSPRGSDVLEVFNYVRALDYGLERLTTLPVSLRLIREVHERLLRNVRGEGGTPGEFRTSQNWIGTPGCVLRDAHFVPPPAPEMNKALDALEKYLHEPDDSFPPLVRLAFIHYQFETIHPFIDGNGRIGRLLIALLLVHWKLLPSPLLYLSAYFERNKPRYYDLLLAVSREGAWREWINFFLSGIAEQARDAIDRSRRLHDLHREWHGRLTTARTSALTLRLLDALFESPILTIPQAQVILGVRSYLSAQLNVKKLVNAGILRPYGQVSYGKMFAAEDIMRIVQS